MACASDRTPADPCAEVSAAQARRIRKRLLAWYDGNRRDLPWRRRAADPYAQWVAEVMLQQTRVATVHAYYERFLGAFPDIKALARASRDDVLRHWAGLGYYRRALHLHAAARRLFLQNEDIPRTAAELARLDGVGRYTAAAVASIAYGEPVAAIDGNVARVIARLFGVKDDITSPAGRKRVGDLAKRLLSRRRPGDFNQAWMDLGSMVCMPRAPQCPCCPLQSCCLAAQTGLADRIPNRNGARQREIPLLRFAVAICTNRGRVLLRKRPAGGLWAGLWELPAEPIRNDESPRRALRRLARREDLPPPSQAEHLGPVNHRLTHRRITFEVFLLRANEKRDGNSRTRSEAPTSSDAWSTPKWVRLQALGDFSVSTATKKILRLGGLVRADASAS